MDLRPLVLKIKLSFSKVCHICSFKAVTNQNLRRHIEAKHEKIRNFTCPFEGCDIKFYEKPAMRNHFKNKHSTETPFKCERCEEAFPVKWKLRNHIERVHEFKKHGCDFCSKEYNDSKSLKEHMIKHHGLDKTRKFKFDD